MLLYTCSKFFPKICLFKCERISFFFLHEIEIHHHFYKKKKKLSFVTSEYTFSYYLDLYYSSLRYKAVVWRNTPGKKETVFQSADVDSSEIIIGTQNQMNFDTFHKVQEVKVVWNKPYCYTNTERERGRESGQLNLTFFCHLIFSCCSNLPRHEGTTLICRCFSSKPLENIWSTDYNVHLK